jgi:hypothetical protein
VADGYMKHGGTGTPVAYNLYAGHDNNRDSYMNALKETTNISRIMYREWFPQIMYNHHQTGPAGSVMFAPPFRDPFNYNFHPGYRGRDGPHRRDHADALSSRKASRASSTRRARTTPRGGTAACARRPYFHNQIGILTRRSAIPRRSRFRSPCAS